MLKSGIWPATQTIPIVQFPHELVLTGSDRALAPRLKAPAILARKKVGTQVVELLVEAGADGSVALSMRVPTAPNQFKDPYILMEAEPGNSSEVALKEFHFHLQGRISALALPRADWRTFFAGAVKKLEALRGRGKRATRPAARRSAPKKRKKPARRR